MKRYLIIILLLFSIGSFAQNTIKISELPAYSANPSGGILPLVVGGSTKKFDAVNFVWTGGAYANPNWITSLAYSKLTGKPTTASGYGITDLYTQSQIQNFFSGTTGVTGYNHLNWDAAYSWGNHSGLYRPITYVPAWSDITGKPSFATVANSGAYSDLTGKPDLSVYALNSGLSSYVLNSNFSWSNLTGKPSSFTPSSHSHLWADVSNRPTLLSNFTNDLGNYGGWITTETDPTIYAWAKASTKPGYSWGEISSKPTALSAFTNDLGNYGNWITGINSSMVTTALGFTPENIANKGSANGYASLGPNAKILTSQLPDGSYLYRGKWNASTNSPTLANGTGTSGWTYRVEVGGTQNLGAGNITFVAGDDVIYNGTVWEKTGNTNLVTSVNGSIGDVTITIPTTLPASDVYAWAKAATKPSYAWSEITSKPTALSAFTNDLGNYGSFLTAESDPSVYAWAKAATKPSYAWGEITSKPTALSAFTNDLGNYGGFLTSYSETDPTISAWAKDTVKPNYAWTEITGKPTALSQFTNDLGNYGGFLTSFTETDPSVYAWAKASTKPTYTKTEIGLSNVVNILQWHDTNHPTTIAGYGITDIPTTLPASDVYAWAKAATKPSYAWSEITAKPTALSAFTNDLGNYGGWITGIDFTAVTTALSFTPVTNARTLTINGTAYDLTANRNWTVGDLVSSGSYANPTWITSLAYSKLTGVPAFLTSYTETDPTVYAWAKAATKPSYAWSEITAKPTALSAFTNDLGNYGSFLTTESDPSVYAWAKASTKPSYAWSEITSKPTALSAFTNDLGNYGSFLTTESDPLVYTWAKSPTKPAYTYAEIGGTVPTWNQNTTGTAANSTSWNGQGYTAAQVAYPDLMLMHESGGTWKYSDAAGVKTFLGLGTNAYTSTAYLPLAGGTLTGGLNGTNASFANDITGYSVGLNGSAGGWARHYSFIGSTGTNRGGFGAFGSDNSLSYYYIGNAYNDNVLQIDASTKVASFSGVISGTTAILSSTYGGGSTNDFLSVQRSGGAVAATLGYDSPNTEMYFGTSTAQGLQIRTGNTTRIHIPASGGNIDFYNPISGTVAAFTGVGINATPTSGATSPLNIRFLSTGSDFYVGTESSTAGSFFAGSSAYASVFYSGQPIQSIISGTKRLEVNASGISVTGTGIFSSTLKQGTGSTFQFGTLSPSGVNTSTGDSYNIPIDIDGTTYYLRLFTGTN